MTIIRTCLVALGVVGLALTFAACEGTATLAQRQKIDRADMPLDRIDTTPIGRVASAPAPATAPATPEAGDATMPAAADEDLPGSYTFTIPPTVTTVKQSNSGMQQYRLYVGQPKAADTPFVVLTVAPNIEAPTQEAQGEPTERTYRLNGLQTQEWKGYDQQHHPYCELLVTHGPKGDQLHAIAVARTNDERALALKILNTIKWSATNK